ncbi:MAG TPA: hypothetical protein VES19_08350 [Candidatus Limnocylindrales bacterium]|nr:hypothetical protein [Candidatus Limnocylindrales bacterium]
MELSTRTRRTLATVLAILLAVETVSAVAAAAATTTVSHPLPPEPPAGQVLAVEATVAPALPVVTARLSAPAGAPRVVEPVEAPVKAVAKAAEPVKAPKATKATKATKTVKAPAKAIKVTKTVKPAAKAPVKATNNTAASYSGANHVWIPELGINKSVRSFPCDRQRPPDNFMYRWGCAGGNNVYLMGHAHSAMNGLHDAYVAGRLHKGMKAYFAGSDGKVHVYTVRWWKKTLPTTDAAWAWAPQNVPSMTLQTCVGRNSEYRLMVRLVEVDD